jgi:hypothetical protein
VYHQKIPKKTSPSLTSKPINQTTTPTPSYGSLSGTIQRATVNLKNLSRDEWQQLEGAIGTRATNEIRSGKRASWMPEFKGIFARLWGDSEQMNTPIQRQVDDSFNPGSYVNAISNIDWSFWFSLINGGVFTNSEHLRINLCMAGVPDSNQIGGTRNQAHHIVEVNDPNAALARHLLYLAEIDINSAINGVFLPEYEADDTGDATVHFGSHRQEYADIVNQALSQAVDTDPVLSLIGVTTNVLLLRLQLPVPVRDRLRFVLRNALHQIRNRLLTERWNLNYGYRVDPDWKPDKPDGDGGTGASGGSSQSSWTRIEGRLVRV